LETTRAYFRADYLCGVPAYINHRLRMRGFNTCVARLPGQRCVLRVSIVPLLDMGHTAEREDGECGSKKRKK